MVLGFERERRAASTDLRRVPRRDRHSADGRRQFRLTARADRIELLRHQRKLIVYKTGAPPGVKEVKIGFAPQLTLEAAMLARGGFEALGTIETGEALYVKIGGAEGGVDRSGRQDEDFAALVDRHFAELVASRAVRRSGRHPISRARSRNS